MTHSQPLSLAASHFAGKPVQVWCANTGQDYGLTDSLRTIHIQFDECRALLRPRRFGGPDLIDAANAAATLAHEVGHIRYGQCELTAENYAMRMWRKFFRFITGSTPDGVDAQYVWAIHESLDPSYRKPCS